MRQRQTGSIETQADGSTVTTETVKVTRKTYAQNWPAYNAAQCREKETVQALLRSLCDGIQAPPRARRGRKPIAFSDAAYAMTMKVYTTFSGRRATKDISDCAEDGHLDKAPSYNSIFDYFDKPEMTPILVNLIEESAKPLASIEASFAVDSTGFGTAVYKRWFDAKYGREMSEATWLKCHAMVGTTTNVVTAVHVTESTAHDSPELVPLLAATAQRFSVAEVSADKAYLSKQELDRDRGGRRGPVHPLQIEQP